MTKKEAIRTLVNYVESDLEAGSFWKDPVYEKEVEAIQTLGFAIKEDEK